MGRGYGTAHFAGQRRLLFRSIWMSALVLGVVLIYAYVGSAGHLGGLWPQYMDYDDLLAEGFRTGHLYIPIPPSPELVAQEDPYDPAWGRLWITDLTLHGAHYYLYWGPLPAALQAITKAALGIYRMIGDQYLTFSFFAVCALFGALLIERLARRLFPGLPFSLVIAAILAFAFANPVPHLTATGGVYQAAISGGQAFSLGGLLFAFNAVWADQSEPERRRRRWLVAAGAFWVLAIACRTSLGPAVACFAFVTVLAMSWPLEYRWKNGLRSAVWISAPMTVGVAFLLAYNKLRFDQWLEFGVNKQLTWFPFRFSANYLGVNLYSYALRSFDWSCSFPYVLQVWDMGARAFPPWFETPKSYLINEPLVGWLRAVPVTWFLPIALLMAAKSIRSLFSKRSDKYAETHTRRAYLWCALCFAIQGCVSGAPDLGLYMATMRYLGDMTYGLVLLGILGAFTLYSWSKTKVARRLVATVFIALSAGTIIIGLLLGYQGYIRHFHLFNPELDAKLTRALSFCEDRK